MSTQPEPAASTRNARSLDWAAYVVGHHPQAIYIWLANQMQRGNNQVPLHAAYRGGDYDYLIRPLHEPPSHYFDDLDRALRDLVIAGSVDAAALFEFRRMLDRSLEICKEMAEFAEWNGHQEMVELYWWHAKDRVDLTSLAAVVLVGRQQPWQPLGAAIGEILHQIVEWSYVTPKIQTVLNVARQLNVTAQSRTLRELESLAERMSAIPEWSQLDERVAHQLESALARRDRDLLTELQENAVIDPLLVIDEAGERLIFLQHSFSFEDFRQQGANGGLQLFLVLARQPSHAIRVDELIEQAGVRTEEVRVSEYFSRFVAVLEPALTPGAIATVPQPSAALKAFIACRRKSRRREKTEYMLQLPLNRVLYRSVASQEAKLSGDSAHV
jgi:hypothetical protein